jgi:hypothetical protein
MRNNRRGSLSLTILMNTKMSMEMRTKMSRKSHSNNHYRGRTTSPKSQSINSRKQEQRGVTPSKNDKIYPPTPGRHVIRLGFTKQRAVSALIWISISLREQLKISKSQSM